ncbi:Ig-like domain-containing protein, partial [Aeromonas sp. JL9]|uniref:Ig-like domain-containing protein n=1 Tax=Aeromonas sp. JL9 TaxID=2950549 RepID=UPI00351DAE21
MCTGLLIFLMLSLIAISIFVSRQPFIICLLALSLYGCNGGGGELLEGGQIRSVQLQPGGAVVLPIGAQLNFVVSVEYESGASELVSDGVEWILSQQSIVSVDAVGGMVALNEGRVTVVASVGGVTSNAAEVTVTDAKLTHVVASPASLTLPKGVTQAVTVEAQYT